MRALLLLLVLAVPAFAQDRLDLPKDWDPAYDKQRAQQHRQQQAAVQREQAVRDSMPLYRCLFPPTLVRYQESPCPRVTSTSAGCIIPSTGQPCIASVMLPVQQSRVTKGQACAEAREDAAATSARRGAPSRTSSESVSRWCN